MEIQYLVIITMPIFYVPMFIGINKSTSLFCHGWLLYKPHIFFFFQAISEEMGIQSYDIISTLQFLGMIKYWRGKHIILKKEDIINQYLERYMNFVLIQFVRLSVRQFFSQSVLQFILFFQPVRFSVCQFISIIQFVSLSGFREPGCQFVGLSCCEVVSLFLFSGTRLSGFQECSQSVLSVCQVRVCLFFSFSVSQFFRLSVLVSQSVS